MKRNTILIDKAAYMYLYEESRKQRGGKPVTNPDKVWNRVIKVKGKYPASENSFGGGDGTYNGKWWSWSLETIKDMLEKAGFTYEEGPVQEYTPAY